MLLILLFLFVVLFLIVHSVVQVVCSAGEVFL